MLYAKLIGGVVLLAFLWWGLAKIHSIYEDHLNYKDTLTELNSERKCELNTVCAKRTQTQADESARKVQAAKDTADAQNAKQKADNDARTEQLSNAHTKVVSQLNKELASRDKKIAEIALHDKPCRDWLNEAIPECVL